ncbi:hypothetical protein M5689_004333 [Euphorbia peplus]|nr:hypothetical protein M5689_004333 [Euphorbia peplus]
MELKPLPSIAFLSTIFLFLLSSTRTQEQDQPQEISSFYEVLKLYDLPPGLFSDIKEYKLNDDTGKFKVRLKNKCKFRIGEVYFKYRRRIRGRIHEGELTHLRGIKVKKHDDWERIKRICRTDEEEDDDQNISNSTQIDTKKKHDHILFMGKEVTFRFPTKKFKKCRTCEKNDDPALNI